MTEKSDCAGRGEHFWQAWLDWAKAAAVDVPASASWAEARCRVWRGSEYVAQACACEPQTLAELLADGTLERSLDPGELAQELDGLLGEVAEEAQLARVLRRFRRRQLVRIIWRDLAGWSKLEETMEELSELADVCIRRGLARLHAWMLAALGRPLDVQGRTQCLAVLGLGKLGGRELNLSSDIDIIFAFPQQGEVEGPRLLSNEQFFTRLAQRLIHVLDSQTADGFVFRVDTRLRPFGESGPLVMSFGAMEEYYQSQAREWERYAMTKARVISADPNAAKQLMAMLRPFVYRRYLDFGAIDSLRQLKQAIAKDLNRKGSPDNIKLGLGGIREIEFIGQAFQLIRGGRDPDLQVRPIREVLSRLGAKGLLPAPAVAQLDQAYCFLRRVENRLQAWRDKQTHSLPREAAARERLAQSMGFGDWPGFAAVLEGHRRSVQAQFDQMFAEPTSEAPAAASALAALWNRDGRDEEAALARAGFADPPEALKRIAQFRESAERRGLSRRGAERLTQLMPLLLQRVAESAQPDTALERVLKVLGAITKRTAYLAMLTEHPSILSQLARLTGMSPWISDQIARYPLLLDELIDPARLYAPLRRADLEAEIGLLLACVGEDDLEQQMEYLRQFALGNKLRVAAADLTEVIPLMTVSNYLSEIAEVTLHHVLRLNNKHFCARHGRPSGVAPTETGFLVLGYGKLGGLELGYGSDLDLVFVHGSGDSNGVTDGAQAIANEQFFARLGQRMIHMLTTRTPSGVLYEVDMRLRPDGNKGLLVRSLPAFAEYQKSAAWTWEHQALVRARPVAGDAALASGFQEVRRAIICRERDPEQLRKEVREMRAKMRASLDRSRGGRFDLKQGSGGIADIEFMVQYFVLRWAADHPELARWTDNVRLLETLGGLGLLRGTAASDLTEAYKALRAASHRSALQDEPSFIADGALRDEREHVRTLWSELMEG